MQTFIMSGTRFHSEFGPDDSPEVLRWSTWQDGPFQQSYAIRTDSGIVLVDPVRPVFSEATDALDSLLGGNPYTITCTTQAHERDVAWFRERYGCPIYAPAGSERAFETCSPDEVYDDEDRLPGNLQAISSGDRTVPEMLLHWQSPETEKGVLFSGDAINGQTNAGGFDGAIEDPFHQVGGIRLRHWGDSSKSHMQQCFKHLLDLRIDLILTGHNPKPIERDALGAISRVLQEGTHETIEVSSFLWIHLPQSGANVCE